MIDNELLSVDDGENKLINADSSLLAKEYYTDYAKYVLEFRALPSVYDGLKPVQRRIIYTANQFPQKLMKTAKMSGAVLAYHPHGSISITGAINDMASPLNVLPLFNTKGNFGGIDSPPAADRYTECYLNEVARANFCQFIDYADYDIGEIGEKEPVALPSLIPYCLFKGSEGIGIGLSTKVMPLNLLDLIDYYIDYIRKDGTSKKQIKPDVGYLLLEMDREEIKEAVFECKGKIKVSSVITQLSNTSFKIEGLYDKIESVINRIDKKYQWFSKEQVGFKNLSTTSMEYVFEIYDESITADQFKKVLAKATQKTGSFSRVLVEDGNAVYSSLDYIIKTSLAYLNKAIDKKIESELISCNKQINFYEVLNLCKKKKVFDNITKMTKEELLKLIEKTSGCSSELSRLIIQKPISYLTTSHEKELLDLQKQLEELENHNRKEYLIKIYKSFRKLVLPIYEEKKHSITKDMFIENPCIKHINDCDFEITDGDGSPFTSLAYFISSTGNIYTRALNSLVSSSITLDIDNDTIVGFATDNSNYIEINTDIEYKHKTHGRSIIQISNIKQDKNYINLRENETISSVKPLTRLSKVQEKYLKGFKSAKTTIL